MYVCMYVCMYVYISIYIYKVVISDTRHRVLKSHIIIIIIDVVVVVAIITYLFPFRVYCTIEGSSLLKIKSTRFFHKQLHFWG